MLEYFINYNNPLFKGMTKDEVRSILKCLNPKVLRLSKGSSVVKAGENIRYIGVMNKGSATVSKTDNEGNKLILSVIKEGEMFAESLVLGGINISPVDITAENEAEVLLFDMKNMIVPCKKVCFMHYLLVKNLIEILARKNIYLNNKLQILSKRTLREKLWAYILYQGESADRKHYKIHITRSGLADYLCVNRSAMTRELGKMKEEGLIDYKGNCFLVLKKPVLEADFINF